MGPTQSQGSFKLEEGGREVQVMCHEKDTACHHVTDFDDGERDLGPWDVGNFQQVEDAKKWVFPYGLQKGM